MKKTHLIVAFVLFSCQLLLAQKTVSGKVNDAEGLPLPGVTIVEEGTNQSTVADFDGVYKIAVKSENAVLSFTYIGFTTKKVAVTGKAVVNVTMQQMSNSLNEVVVVGYGVQKKSDVTGAITSINAKTLESRPQINIQQALQASMPGVNIAVNSNTASGSSTSINIRGRKSISGGSDPLIVLDGVIFSGSLSEVNINDVKNIEVLKDASSAAIYGARGANGVILITTKRGKKDGKPTLNFSTYFGNDIIYDLPDMMDAETFYQRKVERFGEPYLSETERQVYADGKAVDWIKLALRTGTRTEHNLSVSGGTKNSTYFISGNYQKVKGVAINDDFSRINFRANLEIDVTDWLKIGSNTNVTFADKSGSGPSFSESFYMNPLTMPYNEDGSLTKLPWPEDNGFGNPLEPLNYQNMDKSNAMVTNNYFLINVPGLKGLSYKFNTGYNLRNSKKQTYKGVDTQDGYKVTGYAREDVSESKDWLVENVLSYTRSFGKHNIFATALYSAQEKIVESLLLSGSGFPNDLRGYYQFVDATIIKALTPNKTEGDPDIYSKQANESQMLRLNYNYDSKYLFTITGRRDGYSAFGETSKFGLFPSVALGWNIGKESFLENSTIVDLLKLRISYGENGNQAISSYSSLAALKSQNYIDGLGNNLTGYRPDKIGNNTLTWETTTSLNAGIDFGILKSRVSGSVDVYKSKTTDLLLKKSIPAINGDTNILQNIGKTKGEGFEIALNSTNIVSKNFNWSSNLAFAMTRNEIVNVGLLDANGNYVDDIGSKWFIGQPIDADYGYVFNGIWQTDEVVGVDLKNWAVNQAGDVKYKDLDGDGKITTADREVIGKSQPDFTLGFTNSLSYKNFSVDFLIYWVEGVTKNNSLITTDDWALRRRGYNVNYWSTTNPSNDFPENTQRTTNPRSAKWYEDASFARLKDVTISYKLPQDVLDKLAINNLTLFINGKNLVTLTKWSGNDPEMDKQLDRPFSRTILLGLRLGL